MDAAPSAQRASPSARRRARRRATGRRAPRRAAGIMMRQGRAARTSAPLLLARIASGGCCRADPAARRGARAEDARRRGDVHGRSALRLARILSARRRSRRRTAGGGAAGTGRRDRAARAHYATQPAHPEVPYGAPAPRACRLRVGIPVMRAARRRCWIRSQRCAIAGTVRTMDAPPSPRHASPSARGGRGADDARRAQERPPASGGGKHVMPPTWAPGSTVRCTRATGVQSARRRPGQVAAHRRSWARRLPRRAHPHPRVGGRGDGRRAPERAVCATRRPESPALFCYVTESLKWRDGSSWPVR
jgi:hypothetical protein